MSALKIEIGDWVRFYRNGVLVIGVVQYVPRVDVIGFQYYATDMGEVRADSILEVRRQEPSR